MKFFKKSKYKNKKVMYNGIQFDSIHEKDRYIELLLLQRAGEIKDLKLQVPFVLIPSQYERVETGEFYKTGTQKGLPKTKEVCVERACVYKADFTYMKDGKMVVEDAKGVRTDEYVIKRKLMLKIFEIKIKEV